MSKFEKKIIELGEDINNVARDYDYPTNPSTMFLFILASYMRVEDTAGILGAIQFPSEPFLNDVEIEHIKDWINTMWDICETDDDFQLLYDTIVYPEEEE